MHLGQFKYKFWRDAILNSYSQIFFSTHQYLSLTLLIISFFDLSSGICGLLSVLVSILLTKAIGMDKEAIKGGLYSFNNLLVGLGIGLYFEFSFELVIIVVSASLLTTLATFSLQGMLGKYLLPYLSLPFLIGLWISLLATRGFSEVGISARGVYSVNETFAIGGLKLVELLNQLDALIPYYVSTYFKSLGAIFFQYNIFAGLLISIGLLVYSRIIFSLSIIAYAGAIIIYHILGIDINTLAYSYIGFNYILTAIALGGYFLYPNSYSYATVFLLLPITIFLSFGMERILSQFSIPTYSLPFNIIVLMFLYALRFRTHRPKHIREVVIQQDSPEKNVYLQENSVNEIKTTGLISLSLPVLGKWTVNQAYNGEYTHQGDWRHAYDLVLSDGEREFINDGLLVEDYYCYGKNIVAPADGYIVDLVDNIDDNLIGNVDIMHNWGNTVVIQHVVGLCTQVSHLLKDSISVKKGDYVQKGQVIGKVGNSGRSPYPHLHFQVQAAPFIGAKTIEYPISNYITSDGSENYFHSHGTPKKMELVENVVSTPICYNAFNFSPGQTLSYSIDAKGKAEGIAKEYHFTVHSDIWNNTYLECEATKAKAWFYFDQQFIYFTNYQGDKSSFLFYYMLALSKVELAYLENVIVKDRIPTHYLYKGSRLFLQDFIAPFYRYLKADYLMRYTSIDDDFAPQEVCLSSKVQMRTFRKKGKLLEFDVNISNQGVRKIVFTENSEQIFSAQCISNNKM